MIVGQDTPDKDRRRGLANLNPRAPASHINARSSAGTASPQIAGMGARRQQRFGTPDSPTGAAKLCGSCIFSFARVIKS
jgi:hypothetical protein